MNQSTEAGTAVPNHWRANTEERGGIGEFIGGNQVHVGLANVAQSRQRSYNPFAGAGHTTVARTRTQATMSTETVSQGTDQSDNTSETNPLEPQRAPLQTHSARLRGSRYQAAAVAPSPNGPPWPKESLRVPLGALVRKRVSSGTVLYSPTQGSAAGPWRVRQRWAASVIGIYTSVMCRFPLQAAACACWCMAAVGLAGGGEPGRAACPHGTIIWP
jgi:hypothetical protein